MSFVAKALSVLCSLLIVPITINYVNPTQYGIWLALSSIIGWIILFDFGLGNGFRNKFAEAKAKGDIELARQYVSTTYFALAAIMIFLLLVIAVCNTYVNWAAVLNVDEAYSEELGNVFSIVSLFFCVNIVASLFTTILTADQKPGIAAMVGALGQIFSLVVIYLLTLTTDGSLLNLALYYSGIPTLVVLLSSLYAYCFTQYRVYSPRYKSVRLSLIGDIANLGFQFFVIYLSMICIFQVMNIIISRELGPEVVTEYNIAYKYFNVLTILTMIVITPFWSAFTDAFCKSDYQWMSSAVRKLERIWVATVLVSFVMIGVSGLFYEIWIGKDVQIHFSTTVSLALFVSLFNIGQIYMYLINGIGTVRIQLIIYLSFALIAWPSMVFFCRLLGLPGIVVVPSVVVLLQAIFGRIQITKIINRSATGLWSK